MAVGRRRYISKTENSVIAISLILVAENKGQARNVRVNTYTGFHTEREIQYAVHFLEWFFLKTCILFHPELFKKLLADKVYISFVIFINYFSQLRSILLHSMQTL